MCRELKLFGAEIVAIDGSVFKAVNSKARDFTRAKLEGLIKTHLFKILGVFLPLYGTTSNFTFSAVPVM